MPQLDPTWFSSQLFWLAIAFMVLYVLMSRFLLPPIMEVMERRSASIESDIAQAQALKADAQKTKESYERALAEARAKSQGLIDGVMAEQKTKSDHAAKDMEAKIAAKLKEAESKIDAKQKSLFDALIPATSEMATLIAGKVSGVRA